MEILLSDNTLCIEQLFKDWIPKIEISGKLYTPIRIEQPEENVFSLYFPSVVWKWKVEKNEERIWIQSEIENISEQDISLGKCIILDAFSDVYAKAEDVRALGVAQRGQDVRRVLNVNHPDAPEESQIKFQFYSHSKNLALQIGFIGFQRLLTGVRRNLKDGYICGFQAYGDFSGWVLSAGKTTVFEEFTIACGSSPFVQLESWADIVADRIKPVFCREPIRGAAGIPWSYREDNVQNDEEEIFSIFDTAAEKMKGYNLNTYWLSIRNIPGGNCGDWFSWNTKNLPGGADHYISEARKRGFVPGLWIAPFFISSHLEDLVQELKDALLKDENGNFMVFSQNWSHGDARYLPPEKRPDMYGLDPSHPKSLAFIKKVFTYWREKGIRYYMVDFIRVGAGKMDVAPAFSHANPALVQGAESFCNFMRTIREAAGEDTFILTSSGPTFHCTGFVDAVRTAGDMGEGRKIAPNSFFYPASYVINKLDFWTGPERSLYNMASYYTHKKLYINDVANVLTVDKPIPLEYARICATIHGMSGSSSIIGEMMQAISDDRLAIIKKTFPRHTLQARPEDLFTHKEGYPPRIFRYDFEDSAVIAVFNVTKEAECHTLKFPGEFLVWEFWGEQYLGGGCDTFDVCIQPGTVRVFHLIKQMNRPQVIATDMQLLMGEIDTESHWEHNTLYVSAKRPAGERGSVFVYVPEGMYIENIQDCMIAKDGETNEVIVRMPCTFDEKGTWSGALTFGCMKEENDLKSADDKKFE